ncbi:MAG: LytR C-terminal domain-containing protein [Acidimicrobiia bacterium]
MSRQTGGRSDGNSVARGAGFAAAKGAGLIGLAVIIGIVLLNVVDDGDTNQDAAGSDSTVTTTTTVAGTAPTEPTTDTTDAVPAKTPAELVVLVLNGGAPQGTAKEMSDNLKLSEYTNQLQPSDWADRAQAGNLVMCKSGLDQEAAALATAVGEGTPVEPFSEPAPPGSETADCVVVVGTPA